MMRMHGFKLMNMTLKDNLDKGSVILEVLFRSLLCLLILNSEDIGNHRGLESLFEGEKQDRKFSYRGHSQRAHPL